MANWPKKKPDLASQRIVVFATRRLRIATLNKYFLFPGCHANILVTVKWLSYQMDYGELHPSMRSSYVRGLTIGIHGRLVVFIKSTLSLLFLGQPTFYIYLSVVYRPPYRPSHKQKYLRGFTVCKRTPYRVHPRFQMLLQYTRGGQRREGNFFWVDLARWFHLNKSNKWNRVIFPVFFCIDLAWWNERIYSMQ